GPAPDRRPRRPRDRPGPGDRGAARDARRGDRGRRADGPAARGDRPVRREPLPGRCGSADVSSILLVDDRPENLLALEASLEPLGRRLVSATSGEEALRHLLKEEFAVILLDV